MALAGSRLHLQPPGCTLVPSWLWDRGVVGISPGSAAPDRTFSSSLSPRLEQTRAGKSKPAGRRRRSGTEPWQKQVGASILRTKEYGQCNPVLQTWEWCKGKRAPSSEVKTRTLQIAGYKRGATSKHCWYKANAFYINLFTGLFSNVEEKRSQEHDLIITIQIVSVTLDFPGTLSLSEDKAAHLTLLLLNINEAWQEALFPHDR